ncbi:hypothetical protein VB776_17225 [Arcicella sp. DC2W]|uniref:Histidine kinase n=1 Tax=Arcicella gelida TaxID=2984195 RepID=A0ABU5S8D8_9BACT|nr:hypothetical protein [Arcicella sp. DC2W]MEA5404679.1 hypothetical protein [Arcicella sp. DC2W]
METNQTPPKKDFRAWLKRLGWAGFFFFLIKGIVVWILFPYLIAKGFWKEIVAWFGSF